MSRSLCLRVSRSAVFLSVGFLFLFEQAGLADDNPLKFFKNYFLTGDYIAGGVSMSNRRASSRFIDQSPPTQTPSSALPLNAQLTAGPSTRVSPSTAIRGAGPTRSTRPPCPSSYATS